MYLGRTFVLQALIGLVIALQCLHAQTSETDIGQEVHVRVLKKHTWLISSVSEIEGFGKVQSNALLVVGPRESVLIDTPATNEQTIVVLDWAEKQLRRPVRNLVVTHWHQDRMGGIDSVLQRNIATHAFGKTIVLARQHGRSLPQHELKVNDRLDVSGVLLETYYPGHGHTEDNIVVWVAQDRVLDGGCFVKGSSAMTLGNLEEINIPSWRKAIDDVRIRYAESEVVIPGHGEVGEMELLQHTAELLDKSN